MTRATVRQCSPTARLAITFTSCLVVLNYVPTNICWLGSRSVSTSSRSLERRDILGTTAALFSVSVLGHASEANAETIKTVVVAGATGQTGMRIVERLAKRGGLTVVGGVRDLAKAKKAVDEKIVNLKSLDVAKDTVDKMAETLRGAEALVIATGFVPGNPFAMSAEAHAVDNVGTIALVDAAKKAGISKVVLVSSILSNARAWGQENSPGFQITNAFGGVLDEKIVAERYLRASGLDYTIVRPGGLKGSPIAGDLVVSKEDTLNSGEISRDLVADVCIAALFDSKASNKVVEIIENEETPSKTSQDDWFSKV